MLSVDELKEKMRYVLRHLDTKGKTITDQTVHNEVLSDSDGIVASLSTMRLYKAFVRQSIHANNGVDKTWPTTWMTMTVEQLAAKLA